MPDTDKCIELFNTKRTEYLKPELDKIEKHLKSFEYTPPAKPDTPTLYHTYIHNLV